MLGCLDSPKDLCSYHTGSLAFGALILTLVQIARVILEYIDHKLKGEPAGAVGRALERQAGRRTGRSRD